MTIPIPYCTGHWASRLKHEAIEGNHYIKALATRNAAKLAAFDVIEDLSRALDCP